MTACLKRQLDAFDVIEGVADAAGLLRLAESRHLDHAVIEVTGFPGTWQCLAGRLPPPQPLIAADRAGGLGAVLSY